MQPKASIVSELIDALQGTCMSFEEAFAQLGVDIEFNDLTFEQLAEIDDSIFRCAECSWWYEVCEMNSEIDEGETYCKDCCPEND